MTNTKIYGYCRVSTPTQSIDRQVRNIKAAYPDAIIIQEKYTGTTQDRPLWQRLFKKLNAGDVVVFDSVSRMSRNAEEGVRDYKELYDRGVELRFLKEPAINSNVYRDAAKDTIPLTGGDVDLILAGVNAYLARVRRNQIVVAFEESEREVKNLRQRTREGIETARIAGKQIGNVAGSTHETPKAKAAKEVIRKHCKEFGGSLNDAECIKQAGVSRDSYYRYKKQIIAEGGVC